MRLSFSIQNWKKSWDEFREVAGATHMQGIELYNIEGKMFEGKASPTNPERAAYVRRSLINAVQSVIKILGTSRRGNDCAERFQGRLVGFLAFKFRRFPL